MIFFMIILVIILWLFYDFMIFRFFLEILMKSKETPREIIKKSF